MVSTALRWLGALVVFVAIASAGVEFVGDPLLSVTIALCVAVSALLMLRVRREYPDRVTGDSWADKRWTGLSVGVINFAALVGLAFVPISLEYRLAVQILVILVGLVGYVSGSLAEMDREATRTRDGQHAATPVND